MRASLLVVVALVVLAPARARAGTPVEDMALPEPGPPSVERHVVHANGPAPRWYFNPPRPAYHVGLRISLGGGAALSSALPELASGTFHLDLGIVSRVPRRESARRGLDGGYWASAVWSHVGYAYSYSPSSLGAANLFVFGLGLGGHRLASTPSKSSSSASSDERKTAVAIGFTPHILLGRTLDRFAIGMRNTFAIELHRHTVALNFTYDLVRAWEGPLVHDVYFTVGFDPFGFL